MRYSVAAIRTFLAEQPHSGLSVAAFCAGHELKVSTFYAWKRRYRDLDVPASAVFCRLQPGPAEPPPRGLCLPSGLRLELTGLSMREIAALILEIDRAHA